MPKRQFSEHAALGRVAVAQFKARWALALIDKDGTEVVGLVGDICLALLRGSGYTLATFEGTCKRRYGRLAWNS